MFSNRFHQTVIDSFYQVPLISFYGGGYDINVIKNDIFAVLGTENIKNVVRNLKYMCITTIRLKILAKKSKKLISSYFGENILIYTPLLQWYLSYGLIVTKMHSFIKAISNRPFKSFMELVSQSRREDSKKAENDSVAMQKAKEMKGSTFKTVGNSAYSALEWTRLNINLLSMNLQKQRSKL